MEIVVRYEIPCSREYGRVVKDIVKRVQKIARCNNKAAVAIIFVGDKKMRRLNRVYRSKDKVSNVLSFPCDESGIMNHESGIDLGNIFICFPEARREAKKYKMTLQFEIARLAAHGFLHLLGYNHMRAKGERKMEKIENKILKSVVKKAEVR